VKSKIDILSEQSPFENLKDRESPILPHAAFTGTVWIGPVHIEYMQSWMLIVVPWVD